MFANSCLFSTVACTARYFAFVTTLVLLATFTTTAQQNDSEPFGRSFNAGVGPGYFGTTILPSPYFTINYEFELWNNTTLAPFLGLASYRSGPQPYAGKTYYYRATIMPMGLKASYYLDKLLRVPCRWDFYVAASVGYEYSRKAWDLGYPGSTGAVAGGAQTVVLAHLGFEYHLNRATGLFADISNGAAIAGVSLHRM